MNNWIKKREEWVDKSREDFLSIAKEYQDEIVKMLNKQYLPKLDQKDGIIIFSPKNMATIAELDRQLKKIGTLKGDKLIEWFQKELEVNAKLNEKYFQSVVGEKGVANALEKAIRRVAALIGFDKDGRFFDVSRIDDPIRKIKSQAIKAIASNTSWSQFSGEITNFVGKGLVENHLRTNAYDTFQQVDRTINNDMGLDLGLNYAVYSPGLMATSRQFCIDRVGKVFTRDEIRAWEKLEWQGKNDNYNALTDVGGHNCTHLLNWISDKMAFERRPELRK